MRACYRILLVLTGIVALTMSAGAANAAEDKAAEAAERLWNPLSGQQFIMSDVAEVEPNSHLAQAQLLNCGDVLRPATISAAGDTDYVYFNVTAGTIITVGTNADGSTGQLTDSRIRLFNASGAVVASDDDSGPGAYSLLSYTATYTGVYYVGIAGYSASYTGIYQAFITCQVPQPPPANDQCAGAITIECGNVDFSGSTAFATADYTPLASGTGGCTGYPAVGKDVVYVIYATGGDVLDVNYTSVADGSVYLITDCANPTTTCVAGADATLTGVAEHLVYNVTTSGTYYLILDNYGTGAGGAYTLTGTYTCPATAVNRKSWGSLKSIYR
jgi:serralysin